MNTTKLILLDQLLSNESFPSMAQLQRELGLSKSKVYAYMRGLRAILNCDIGQGPRGHGFGYVGPRIPKLPLLVELGIAGALETETTILHALAHHLSLHVAPRGTSNSYHILPHQIFNHDDQMLLLAARLPEPKLVAFRLNRVIVQDVEVLPRTLNRLGIHEQMTRDIGECWKAGSFQTVLVA